LFRDNPGRPVPEKKHQFFWIFMEQGKIIKAEVPTIRVGATPTGLTPPPPKVFYRPDALPAAQPTASKH